MKITELNRSGSNLATVRRCLFAAIVCCIGLGSVVVAQEKISKLLLIKISRDQSQVLCTSEIFTQCMGFTETACLDLSEKALEQCILPLPDTIVLAELDNDTLESCPKTVYADAGYADEKAVECLQKALSQ